MIEINIAFIVVIVAQNILNQRCRRENTRESFVYSFLKDRCLGYITLPITKGSPSHTYWYGRDLQYNGV